MAHPNPTVEIDNEAETAEKAAPAPPKVGFVSLGCPKNLVDSEVMMGMRAQAGAQLIARAEDADVIVVNTCSFIESGQRESGNGAAQASAPRAQADRCRLPGGPLSRRHSQDHSRS